MFVCWFVCLILRNAHESYDGRLCSQPNDANDACCPYANDASHAMYISQPKYLSVPK